MLSYLLTFKFGFIFMHCHDVGLCFLYNFKYSHFIATQTQLGFCSRLLHSRWKGCTVLISHSLIEIQNAIFFRMKGSDLKP